VKREREEFRQELDKYRELHTTCGMTKEELRTKTEELGTLTKQLLLKEEECVALVSQIIYCFV